MRTIKKLTTVWYLAIIFSLGIVGTASAKTWYSAEEAVGSPIVVAEEPEPITIEIPVEVCGPDCIEYVEVCGPDCVDEPIIEYEPSPGNKHAVVHSTIARTRSDYNGCATCHQNGGDAVVGENDTMLCSQYPYAFPGRTILDPLTGENAFDPVSGTEIVSGDGIAVLYTGDTVRCSDCHNPHRRATDGSRAKVEDFMVHAGCLDCHEKPGSSDR